MGNVLHNCAGRIGWRNYQAVVYDDQSQRVVFLSDSGQFAEKTHFLTIQQFALKEGAFEASAKQYALKYFEEHPLKFFSHEVLVNALAKLLVTDIGTQPEGAVERWQHVLQVSRTLIRSGDKFDMAAPYCISKFGRKLFDRINAVVAGDSDSVDDFFVLLFAFCKEIEISDWIPSIERREIDQLLRFVEERSEGFSPLLQRKLAYPRFTQISDICSGFVNHPSIRSFRNFEETMARAESLRREWIVDLSEKTTLVKSLSDSLDKLQSGYHFVKLVHAFKHLLAKKTSEARTALLMLLLLGVSLTIPLLYGLINVMKDNYQVGDLATYVPKLLPIISLELLLIYFFKIVLANYRSAKAQILQIELRQALCQFIEGYSAFSRTLKTENQDALDKFETLIFSNLVYESSAIPSTFDGVEQLASLIGKVKGS